MTTINEFIKEEKERLNKFEVWCNNHKRNIDSNWFEQYKKFREDIKKDMDVLIKELYEEINREETEWVNFTLKGEI